MPKVDLLYC